MLADSTLDSRLWHLSCWLYFNINNPKMIIMVAMYCGLIMYQDSRWGPYWHRLIIRQGQSTQEKNNLFSWQSGNFFSSIFYVITNLLNVLLLWLYSMSPFYFLVKPCSSPKVKLPGCLPSPWSTISEPRVLHRQPLSVSLCHCTLMPKVLAAFYALV